MKKFFVFLSATIFIHATSTIVDNVSQWNGSNSNIYWGSGGSNANWVLPYDQFQTSYIPGVTNRYWGAKFVPLDNRRYPEINQDLTIRQFVIEGPSTTQGPALTTNGETKITFQDDTSINHFEIDGYATIQSSFMVPAGKTVNYNQTNQQWLLVPSKLLFNDTATTVDLLEGTGTLKVQANSVLYYNPTAEDSGYTNNYQFTGTIDIDNPYATWVITNAKGPFTGTITGSNVNALVRLESDLTLHNNQMYYAATNIDNKTLTLASGGSLPNSPVMFTGENPKLVLEGDATISALLQQVDSGSSPTIELGSNTLTIDQGYESLELGFFEGDQSYDIKTNNDWRGVISGAGNVIRKGDNFLTISSDQEYTGTTIFRDGQTTVNGSLASSSQVTIESTAQVFGTGTFPTLINNATLQPGNSVGTITIDGDYTQGPDGILKIEVSSEPEASKLIITGQANLNGVAFLDLQKGIFPEGTTVTFIEAAGGRNGEFSALTDEINTDFTLAYNGDMVQLTVPVAPKPNPSPTPPPNNTVIHAHLATADITDKNAHTVSSYLFTDVRNATFNTEIVTQLNKVMANDATTQEYLEGLVAISPIALNAIDFTHAQNIETVARSVDEMFISQAAHRKDKSSSEISDYAMSANQEMKGSAEARGHGKPKRHRLKKDQKKDLDLPSVYGHHDTSFYVSPFFIYYDQNRMQGNIANIGQVPFQEYTIGLGGGYEFVSDDNFVFELGGGYSYTNLDWQEGFGQAQWSSLYLAPFLGWFNKQSFLNGMVLGGFNFTHVLREIPVNKMNVRADSSFMAYDILARLNGGHRFSLRSQDDITDWLQFEGTINYLNIYTEGFTETGAGALNLQYKDQWQLILMPMAYAKYIHEVITPKGIFAPVVKVGWMGTYPLTRNVIQSRLNLAPTSYFFGIQGYKEMNQMIVGGEFFYKSPNGYKLTSGFDTYFFAKSVVFAGSLKYEWLF